MNTEILSIIGDNFMEHSHTFQITKKGVATVFLVMILLSSAFSVVYIKDLNRRLFIRYQILQREKSEELVQWEKLLLKEGTWSTQWWIQQAAERQLEMKMPTAKEVVLVNEYDKTNITHR